MNNKEAIKRLNEHLTTFQHLMHPATIEALEHAIKILKEVKKNG